MGCGASKNQAIDQSCDLEMYSQDAFCGTCPSLQVEDDSYKTTGGAEPPSTAEEAAGGQHDQAGSNVQEDIVALEPYLSLPAGPEAFESSTSDVGSMMQPPQPPRIPTFAPLEVHTAATSAVDANATADSSSPVSGARSTGSAVKRPPGISQARSYPHPLQGASGTSTLMPSIQSSEADRLRSVSWSVPSGPSREPSISSTFMTLVPGDGPTSQQMWAQLGADVMMEIARRQQAVLEQSTLSQI